jgi:hypothetical protein
MKKLRGQNLKNRKNPKFLQISTETFKPLLEENKKKTAILTASPFSEEILIISFFIKIYL